MLQGVAGKDKQLWNYEVFANFVWFQGRFICFLGSCVWFESMYSMTLLFIQNTFEKIIFKDLSPKYQREMDEYFNFHKTLENVPLPFLHPENVIRYFSFDYFYCHLISYINFNLGDIFNCLIHDRVRKYIQVWDVLIK